MRWVALGMRWVLWAFFGANLCVTLVLLSGGSFPVMSMVACVLLFAALAVNYSVFDRKGNLREKDAGQDHPELGIPMYVARRDDGHLDLESFDWKSHRNSDLSGRGGVHDVRAAQALGDGPAPKVLGEHQPDKPEAVD